MDIKEIRKAVCKYHGGLDEATDGQILIIWNALDKETQQRYSDTKGKKDGVCSRS